MTETDAYDGSNYPPSRELTARERDILSRGLHSVIYPFTEFGWTSFGSSEARAAIMEHTRFYRDPDDIKVLYNILQVIDPRNEVKDPEIPI